MFIDTDNTFGDTVRLGNTGAATDAEIIQAVKDYLESEYPGFWETDEDDTDAFTVQTFEDWQTGQDWAEVTLNI